jgi:hypothetical protein
MSRAAARPAPGGTVGGKRAVSGTGSAPGIGGRGAYSRPSAGELGSFLNLPAGAPKAGAFSETPSQLPSGGQTRSYTTARGGTITVGGKGGSTTTGSGATVGAGVGGVKLETAGGGTYGKVGAVAGGTGAGGSAAAGRSVSGFRGAGGTEGARLSGGAASSSGYRRGGSVSAVQGRHGYTAVNVRGGYGAGGTGRIGSATAIVGPGGNVVSAGRGASFVNGQFVGGQAWRGVNGAFNHWGWYGAGWWGGYPGAWFPGRWALATTAWATAAWAVAGPYCGCDSGSAAYYDYGENVGYGDDGMVYADDQPVATDQEYYDQAAQIADNGQAPQNEDWLPLGIFAVVASEDQTQTDKIVQLALNKEGVIRGNYHDLLADKVTPVSGAVDKQTQRVALRIEGNDQVLVETGLYNLTNDEAPVLVHFGPDRQEQRTFVRLQPPKSQGAATEESVR